VDDPRPPLPVGARHLVEADRRIDVAALEMGITHRQHALPRKRHAADLAHAHHIEHPVPFHEAVGQQRPVRRLDQGGVPDEELHGLVEETAFQITAPHQDLGLTGRHRCAPSLSQPRAPRPATAPTYWPARGIATMVLRGVPHSTRMGRSRSPRAVPISPVLRMPAKLNITYSAYRELELIPQSPLRLIGEAIIGLADDPYPTGAAVLQGVGGCYYLAIDDYYILYHVDEEQDGALTVLGVAELLHLAGDRSEADGVRDRVGGGEPRRERRRARVVMEDHGLDDRALDAPALREAAADGGVGDAEERGLRRLVVPAKLGVGPRVGKVE